MGQLLLFNALDVTFQAVALPKRKDCKVCG